MPKQSCPSPKPLLRMPIKVHRRLIYSLVFASIMGLGGCAVEVENLQAAQEVSKDAQAPGSVYAGWRVFQDKCAACHGPAALGTGRGPDLLPKVRDMGPRQFVGWVLTRYDLNLPPDQVRSTEAARDALIDDLLQRRSFVMAMPAWQSEPRVNAHIMDLFAYLSARAQGQQGPDRPTR